MNAERIAIVVPDVSGHRLTYVRALVEEAMRREAVVLLLTPIGGTSTAEFNLHLREQRGFVEVIELATFTASRVAAASRAWAASTTVAPDGDSMILELLTSGGWRGGGTLTLLAMRESSQLSTKGIRWWAETAARRLVLASVNAFPRVRCVALKPSTWSGRSWYPVVRDPVFTSASKVNKEEARRQWTSDDGRVWFSVLGSVTARKNVRLIVEALEPWADRTGLLIAGSVDPAIWPTLQADAQRLAGLGAKVSITNRLLTDEELDTAILSSDFVVLAHSNEGPSGILGKAIAASVGVVAAGARSLRSDLASLNMVEWWCPLDRRSLSILLGKAIEGPMSRRDVTLPSPSIFASALIGAFD